MFSIPKIKISFLSLLITALIFYDGGHESLCVILATLIHEAGHIILMLINGIGIKEISLSPYGFEITPKRQFANFFEEISISVAGCYANFLCFILLFKSEGYYLSLAYSSLALGLMNALPITGLDGGYALRSAISFFTLPEEAQRLCRAISFIFLFLLWIPAAYIFFSTGYNYSLFLICLWLFCEIFL